MSIEDALVVDPSRVGRRTPVAVAGVALLTAGCYLVAGTAGLAVGVAAGVVRWRASAPLALAAVAVGLVGTTAPPTLSTAVWALPVSVPYSPLGVVTLAVGAVGLVVEPSLDRPTGRVALGTVAVVGALGVTVVAADGWLSLWTATAAVGGVVVALAGVLARATRTVVVGGGAP